MAIGLRSRFNAEEHIYINGEWRVKSAALKHRFNTTTQRYTTTAIETVYENVPYGRVVVKGGLSLEQETRYDVGIGLVDTSQVVGETAYEQAVDHLYWRLAQHWSIGVYLNDVPSEVKTVDQLQSWLEALGTEKA